MLVCEGYDVVQLYVLEYLSGIKFLFHGGGEAIGVARLRGGVQVESQVGPPLANLARSPARHLHDSSSSPHLTREPMLPD
ncbi:hypothetical protein PF005_g26471 [Phytophthora fragariae]|uniref:Uncharacterized protein n=1 Tax=Phytophthora fragariae TaxID=53985 RepID=A0A6A3QZV1_9STRA|nr:hypothetical protein PF003_g34510 [Phytophthora fragariae]KAE8923003.1 hypothetical protein PF009_g26738 [Phytophthora fragariae]KAE8970838.1 hypothetical protein PF011_g26263 [Phytophthora fragariae]KAE9071060.1 hypothetical protein PF010_g26025 [Phytophthora fragariae]KAE9071551.1 hypothetical protein PF007_g26512 [Phytophthora fragariae]